MSDEEPLPTTFLLLGASALLYVVSGSVKASVNHEITILNENQCFQFDKTHLNESFDPANDSLKSNDQSIFSTNIRYRSKYSLQTLMQVKISYQLILF